QCSCSKSACIFTNCTIVSLQNRFQSSRSDGLCGDGAYIGIGTCSHDVTVCPQKRRPSFSLRFSIVSYFACNQKCHSSRDASLKENSVSLLPIELSICHAMSCG